MRMKYVVRNIGEVAIVDLSGSLSPGRTIEDRLLLLELVTGQFRNGRKKILLNFADVSFIDSSGIGDLMGALRMVNSEGGQLGIFHASQRVSDLLYRTHLDSIIPCYSDEASALKSLSGDSHGTISAA